MLATLFVILVGLWLLGMFTSYSMGGLVHLLLIFAIVVLIFRFLPGKRTV